nr:MAG TPA: hypothetical protein [Caudoviricetes sp.]
MALNFTGTDLSPKRGGNPLGRKLEGVRVARLKKGQNQITLGEDVMEQLGLTAEKIDGKLNAAVTAGTGKFEGKLLIKFGEGPFLVRWTSPKRKTSVNIMSSALPVEHGGKAEFKAFPEENAVVIQLPTAPAADASGDLSA